MATLKTKLTLDMKGFRAGLKRASRGIKNFGRNIGKPLVAGIKNVAKMTAAVVALGAALAALAVNRLATMGDEIGKMAKRTGISAEEISRLRHAADLSGTSIEALEKSTRRMQASIHEAGRGTKTYTDALAAIGLEYKDLKGLNTEEQFDKTLKALADTEDQTTKTAIAMQIFGRSGTAMLPMLADGAKGLEDMKKEADRLGLVLTSDQVRQAELYKDQISRLKGAFMGLTNAVVPMEGINRALQVLIDKVVSLRQSDAFGAWVDKATAGGLKVATVIINLGKAIHSFAVNSSDNMRKFAAVGLGVFIAFKTGLAVPLIKLFALLGKSIITLLVGPFGAALAALVVLIATFNIGKAIGETFDLGHFVAVGIEHLKVFGKTVAAFFASIGPDFKSSFNKALRGVGEEGARNLDIINQMRGGNGKTFGENLQDQIDGTISGAKAAGKKLTDALVPESIKGLLGDLGNLGKPLNLPKLEFSVPEGMGDTMATATERGVVKGMSNRKWGRVFTGERQGDIKPATLAQKHAKAQLTESKQQTTVLRKIARGTEHADWAWAYARG